MTMVLDEAGRPRLARDQATSDVALESAGSAVSWGAIIGGAVAAAAVSLLLLLLGSGIGLTVVSPWGTGASLTTVAASALIWMIVVHWIGSAVGGYLTGRLRTPWAGVHAHEVTFRDTANGFLTWGLAVLLVTALAGMSASAVLFTGVQATATVAAGAAQGAAQGATQQSGGIADPTAYFVDTLFRPATPAAAPTTSGATTAVNTDVRTEVSRILVKDIAADQFPADDRAYLADLVVARTGLPADVAKMRVDSVVTALNDAKVKAKAAADAARKAAATAALGLVLALLIGAFVASAAAALGGHMRDQPNYPR